MNNVGLEPITIALERKAFLQASYFAAQQANVPKGRQVYLNTLAIYGVRQYLNFLQIESQLPQSDSFGTGVNSLGDFADLFIPRLGRLECRPVLPKQDYLTIPPQVSEERIGYVAVKFKNQLDRVELIGFLPTIAPSNQFQDIPLSRLQSLEALHKTIDRFSVSQAKTNKIESKLNISLNKWWSGRFEPGWLSLENLFGENTPVANLAWRSQTAAEIKVKRGKVINLGDNSVILIVTCAPIKQAEIDILLQVYPVNGENFLPANLELNILDETNTLIPDLEAKSRAIDNCLQLSFNGEPGESFCVSLTSDRLTVTENFQL